jgi:hypothetical protein
VVADQDQLVAPGMTLPDGEYDEDQAASSGDT